jgi:hypothetical protein
MNLSFGDWPVTGVLAAVAIVVGIVLLVVYAVGRGLVHGDLPGTVETAAVPTDGPVPGAGAPGGSRVLGTAGAVILVAGLALGLVTAVAGWGARGTSGSSSGGTDCAQSWSGCPQNTLPPTANPSLPSVVP